MATPVYKLKDDHAAAIGHVREAYTTLDVAKLNKTGGVITGPIYETNNTDPLNALATKSYVLANAGSGGGGGGQIDLIQTVDGTTRVKCEADGVKI
jgi:hypothetical protein